MESICTGCFLSSFSAIDCALTLLSLSLVRVNKIREMRAWQVERWIFADRLCGRIARILPLSSIQRVQLVLQLFEFLARFGEFALSGEALVVFEIFGSGFDERIHLTCVLSCAAWL